MASEPAALEGVSTIAKTGQGSHAASRHGPPPKAMALPPHSKVDVFRHLTPTREIDEDVAKLTNARGSGSGSGLFFVCSTASLTSQRQDVSSAGESDRSCSLRAETLARHNHRCR